MCCEMMMSLDDIFNIGQFVCCIEDFSWKELQLVMTMELILKLNVIHIFYVIKVFCCKTFMWMQGQSVVIPMHAACVIIKLDGCFGKEIGAEHHVVEAVITVKEESFLM